MYFNPFTKTVHVETNLWDIFIVRLFLYYFVGLGLSYPEKKKKKNQPNVEYMYSVRVNQALYTQFKDLLAVN